MLIRGVTENQLHTVAEKLGVEIRGSRHDGTGVRFTIVPKSAKYQRTSASHFNRGRKVNAVCWHGHRDFYRAIFDINPHTVIITALARYNGREHFEKIYPGTDKNIGPQISPIYYSEACTCATAQYVANRLGANFEA